MTLFVTTTTSSLLVCWEAGPDDRVRSPCWHLMYIDSIQTEHSARPYHRTCWITLFVTTTISSLPVCREAGPDNWVRSPRWNLMYLDPFQTEHSARPYHRTCWVALTALSHGVVTPRKHLQLKHISNNFRTKMFSRIFWEQTSGF